MPTLYARFTNQPAKTLKDHARRVARIGDSLPDRRIAAFCWQISLTSDSSSRESTKSYRPDKYSLPNSTLFFHQLESPLGALADAARPRHINECLVHPLVEGRS